MLIFDKKTMQCLSSILVLTMMLVMVLPMNSAHALDAINAVPIGNEGYLSSHMYASPTNEKDVYKIDVSLEMQAESKPLAIVLVMDETGSTRHVASRDAKDPVTKNYQPRWNMQLKQYNDIIDLLSDESENIDYADTYVAVISFVGRVAVRTSDGLLGEPSYDPQNPHVYDILVHTLEQKTPSDQLANAESSPYPSITTSPIDLTTRLSSYALNELYFKVPSDNVKFGTKQGTAGFVKISDSESKLRNTLPKYPYLSYDLAKEIIAYDPLGIYPGSGGLNSFGTGWFIEGATGFGSNSCTALYEAYNLLIEVNNQLPEVKKTVVLFSDNLDDNMGPKDNLNDQLFNAAALIKAPKTVMVMDQVHSWTTLPGAEAELMTVGMGFGSFDNSGFPGGRSDQDWYRTVADQPASMSMSYGYLEHRNDWATNYKPWVASLAPELESAPGVTNFPDAYRKDITIPGYPNPHNPPGGEYHVLFCDDVWDFCAPYMETQLVALGAVLNDNTEYGSPSAPSQDISGDYAKIYHDNFRFYADNAKYENNKILSNYSYIDSVNSTVAMFDNLVRSFMKRDTMKVDLKLSDSFELYNMSGSPLFETNLSKSSISNSDKSIVWNIDGHLPINELHTLTFYVKVTNKVGQNVFANVFESSTITFERNGLAALGESPAQLLDVKIGFTNPYISISTGEIQNGNSNSGGSNAGGSNTSEPGKDGSSGSGLIPMFLGGLDMHTPSVTPSNEIASETLAEGARESFIPSTNTSGIVAIVSLCFVAIVSATFVIRTKRKRNDSNSK